MQIKHYKPLLTMDVSVIIHQNKYFSPIVYECVESIFLTKTYFVKKIDSNKFTKVSIKFLAKTFNIKIEELEELLKISGGNK